MTTPKPICPNCGYDLTGLIKPEASTDCPECNAHSTYAQATEHISRYSSLRKSVFLLLIAPQFIHLWSYLIYSKWDALSEVALITLGFIPVAFMFWYVLTITIIALVSEHHARKGKAHSKIKPSKWVCYTTILICVLITMTVNAVVGGLWADAIAYI